MKVTGIEGAAIVFGLLGIAGCIVGVVLHPNAFFRVWLCSYLFWLGVPLAGIALVLVHDLTGGAWMATARGPLTAAALTMPLASVAGIPAFIGLRSLYGWTHPASDLANVFYLNPAAFFIRYGCYVVVWNVMAAFVVFGPREGRLPISPALSWISGIALVVLAFSASFAAIDWILSLEPKFWSSIFPYTQATSWFNTGFAMVLLTIALVGWPAVDRRKHMVDLTQILLATTIFWAYLEFMQFLIIWEENLKHEIPWYLKRLESAWHAAIYVSAGLGFVVPFFVLLWAPSKRRRAIVAMICALILISRLANTWLLVMPEFGGTPFWFDMSAVLALGGAVLLLFAFALRTLPGRACAPWPGGRTMPDRVRSQRLRRRTRAARLGGAIAVLAWGFAWRQMVRRSRQQEAMAAAHRDSERPMTAYETSDWDLGPVGLIYLGTIALLVISCLVLMVAYPGSLKDVSRTLHVAPPGPRLQINPAADLARFRGEEEKQLETYYWADRQKGLVHVPIEDAMKKLVATGIPGFPKALP